MLVKFANIVAIGFAAFGVQQAIATPVHDTETHDIARRSRDLKCGWVKSRHGKDLGCLCDSIMNRVNADFDLNDVLNVLWSKGSKRYPPGCKPNCDGNGGYDCPNGKDSKGNCLDDHGCEGGSSWDNGKCCPGGTVNKDGICCPPGCSNKGGKCHVDEPPKEPPKQTCGENEEHKDGMCKCKPGYSKEHDKAPCMKNCPHGQKRVGKDCVCEKEHQELFKGECKDKCKPPAERDEHGNCKIKCPEHTTHDGKECVCDDKSKKLVNGRCEPKCPGAGQKFEHDKCVCEDKSKKLVNGHCEDKCPAPYQMYEAAHDKCVCKDKGKKLVNGHCEDKCPAPQQMYEAAHDKCVCTDKSKQLVNGHCEDKCPAPQQKFEHDKCVCTDKSKKLVNGHCEDKCPAPHQKFEHDKCVCTDKSKKLVNGHCEDRCPAPEQKFEHDKCVCTDMNKKLVNGHCEVVCPKDQMFEHNKCVCKDTNKELVNGHCEPKCPHDQERRNGHCECKMAGFVKDKKDVCRPDCKAPFKLNEHENRCDCPKNFDKQGDKCVIKCKDGNEPDSTGMKCVCHAPKVVDKHGKCVAPPQCAHPSEELNTWNNKCECAKGYERDWHTGKCNIKCRGDKKPDDQGKMCVCPEGKVEKEHNKNQCVDPAPTCTHPEKLHSNGKKCVCEDGFKRKNGVCQRDCGWGKKWCKTKCCREDQEEKDNGECGCPGDWKDLRLGGITICKPPVLSKIL